MLGLGIIGWIIIGGLADTALALKLQSDQLAIYAERRRIMADILAQAGIEFQAPAGTFYFFPKAPNGLDDVAFVQKLAEQRILAVPGSGFGYAGYFRIAICVDKAVIERSRDGFIAAAKA